MPPSVVALFFALGTGVWVYSKFYRSTGGNNQNSIMGGVIVGIFAYVLMLIILGMVERALQ